jgi:hypothetical protein
MRRLLPLLATLALMGCVVEQTAPPNPYPVLPPPRVETVPRPPGPNVVWEPGQWHWNGRDYVWLPGHYVERAPGRHWEPGHWVLEGRNWVWLPGRWV